MSPDPQVRLQQWNHRDEVYLNNKINSTDSETCVEVTVLLVGVWSKQVNYRNCYGSRFDFLKHLEGWMVAAIS